MTSWKKKIRYFLREREYKISLKQKTARYVFFDFIMWFFKLFIFAFISIFILNACGDVDKKNKKTTVKVTTSMDINPLTNLPEHIVEVQSVVDSIRIEKVIVNKGNCKSEKIEKNLGFGQKTKVTIGMINIFTSLFSGCEISDVVEIEVVTDMGNWKFDSRDVLFGF
ncbi:hypothetical protein [Helicobacter sp. T3_23-1059]